MKIRAVVIVSLLGLAGAAWAKMKPGKYEVSMVMEMNGRQMPPRTETKCFTEKDGEHTDWVKKMQRDPSCQMENLKNEGNHISFDMVCPKDHGKGHGELNLTGEGMTMTMTMDMAGPKGQQMSFKSEMKSHRVGDCP